MIQAIACDIESIVLSSNYVNKHFPYCELYKKDGITRPGQYISGGNYGDVLDADVNGTSYLRRNGEVTYSAAPAPYNKKAFGCGVSPFQQMTIPFRLVMTVPKNKLRDDAFSDDRLVNDMVALINGARQIDITGVPSLSYNVTKYDIDALSIWSEEIKGYDYQMNFEFAYVAININAVVIANPACLISDCVTPPPTMSQPKVFHAILSQTSINDAVSYVLIEPNTLGNVIITQPTPDVAHFNFALSGAFKTDKTVYSSTVNIFTSNTYWTAMGQNLGNEDELHLELWNTILEGDPQVPSTTSSASIGEKGVTVKILVYP